MWYCDFYLYFSKIGINGVLFSCVYRNKENIILYTRRNVYKLTMLSIRINNDVEI